ncbi:MAG: hypothetical protein GY941_08695 [Planctomycetes bacterium]|nr:hypothetical protein [Planctomycetota bacterium]
MIEYVKSASVGYWSVAKVDVTTQTDTGNVYCELDDKNIVRIDSIGEFLNRPIIILNSRIV